MAKDNKKTGVRGQNPIRQAAARTLKLESEAVAKLIDYIDEGFVSAASAILKSKGRLVVTGIGKSANIAQKNCRYPQQHRSACAVYACGRCHSR